MYIRSRSHVCPTVVRNGFVRDYIYVYVGMCMTLVAGRPVPPHRRFREMVNAVVVPRERSWGYGTGFEVRDVREAV